MTEVLPVATVHSSRCSIEDDDWDRETVSVRLRDELPTESLEGIEAFSHLEIIFHLHLADKVVAGLRHPRNNESWPAVGVFARRDKNRPNHLGSTVVELVAHEGRSLRVRGLDAIDGTPVIDIKPVFRQFLPRDTVRQPVWVDELMAEYWSR